MKRSSPPFLVSLVLGSMVLALGCAAREQLAPALSGGRLSRADARAAQESYERGLADYQAGSYEAAVEAFTTIVERYPASGESGLALYWRGRALYQLRRPAESVEALNRYLALSPAVPFREHAILILASGHFEQRQLEPAITAALRIDRVSQPRLEEFLALARDLLRQLPRSRIEAIAGAEPSRNFLAPFYLQAARWAQVDADEARVRTLARKVLAFPELPPTLLDDARRLAGGAPSGRAVAARIGFLTPTEGRFAPVSEEVRRGIEIALAELNQGRRAPIELVTRASAGDPDSTAEVIRSLSRDEQVQAILGPLVSEIAVPAARAASEEGVPLVSPTATDARLLEIGPRVYTVNAIDGAIGHTLGTFAVRVLERKRFAILAVDNVYGRIQADAFAAAIQAGGARVVGRHVYESGSTQFTDPLGAFVRSQADAIFIATKNPQEALRILNQMAFYELWGMTPLGTDAWNDEEFYRQGRGFARGYFADTFSRDSRITRWEEFAAAYEQRYGEPPKNLIPAWGYDATRLAVEFLAEMRATTTATGGRPVNDYRGASALFRTRSAGIRRAVVVHRIEQGEPVAVDW
ncbi:MAG: ABC transporter substrate-binding protein [Gemmatimonadota bacterium]